MNESVHETMKLQLMATMVVDGIGRRVPETHSILLWRLLGGESQQG